MFLDKKKRRPEPERTASVVSVGLGSGRTLA